MTRWAAWLSVTCCVTTASGVWTVTGNCTVVPEEPECVTSQNYPQDYGDNEYCSLQIDDDRQRMLLVSSFSSMWGNDLLYIDHDHFSGRSPDGLSGRVVNKTTSMWWKTDASRRRGGWKICALAFRDPLGGPWHVSGDCQVDTSDPECVTSPNFPNDYNNNDTCKMRIFGGPRVVDITDFDTEYKWDKLEATGSFRRGYRYSGSDLSGSSADSWQGATFTERNLFTWTTDQAHAYGGWRFCARLPTTTTTSTSTTSTWTTKTTTRTRFSWTNRDVQLGPVSSEDGGNDGGNGMIAFYALLPALALLIAGCFFWFGCKTDSSTTAKDEGTTAVPPIGQRIQCQACSHTFVLPDATSDLTYTCPACLAVIEFSITQELAGTLPAEAPLPHYWTSERALGTCEGLVQETAAVQRAMQILMDQTWKETVTRDRPSGEELCKFEVLMVHRNENMHKWDRYVRTRTRIAQECQGCRLQQAKTLTQVTDFPEAFEFHFRSRLDPACNEFFLFHGTNPTAARAICDNSFRMNMAGSHAGSLYGAGLYFAEASTKADEYASEEPEGIFAGQYAMLVCRVVCGNMLYTDEEWPDSNELVQPIVQGRVKHSVLGDRESCRGTYREFVVFDRDQVYPEYAIIYRRVPVHREEVP